MRILTILLLCHILLPATELPRARAGEIELSGTFRGEPFWLRLHEPAERFAGQRVLELLYTPADATELAGTQLQDHPFLLLDEHLRIKAWNERGSSLSVATWTPGGYTVQLEIAENEQIRSVKRRHEQTTPAWDRFLAPLLLLLVAAAPAEVPVLDLFDRLDPVPGTCRITATQVVIDQQVWQLERNQAGHIVRVSTAEGTFLVACGPLPQRPLSSTVVDDTAAP